MKKLLLLFTILTVGMVTAQGSGQYQESTDIGYNTNGTITVDGETYALTDTQRIADLSRWYPTGTTKAYNWRTDKENLEHKLDRMRFSYAPGVAGDLDGDGTSDVNAYRLQFIMENGYGGSWGFGAEIPDEAYRTDATNELVLTLEAEPRDDEGNYNPAIGYEGSISATLLNDEFSGDVRMGFQIRVNHPDNPSGDLYNIFPVSVHDQGLNDGVELTAPILDNLNPRGSVDSSITTHTLARNTITNVYQTEIRDNGGRPGDDTWPETTIGRYIFSNGGSSSISIRNKPIRIRYEIGRPVVPSNVGNFWND